MPVHPTGEPVSSADCPAAEQLLLTIGRAGVLSSRAIAAGELEDAAAPPRPASPNVSGATSSGPPISSWSRTAHVIYWPRTGEQFADAAYAMARVQATLA